MTSLDRDSQLANTMSEVTTTICIVEAAAMVGSPCHWISEKMCSGRVFVLGPERNRAILMSLKDKMNANTLPETRLDLMSGIETFQNAWTRLHPRLIAASSIDGFTPESPA